MLQVVRPDQLRGVSYPGFDDSESVLASLNEQWTANLLSHVRCSGGLSAVLRCWPYSTGEHQLQSAKQYVDNQGQNGDNGEPFEQLSVIQVLYPLPDKRTSTATTHQVRHYGHSYRYQGEHPGLGDKAYDERRGRPMLEKSTNRERQCENEYEKSHTHLACLKA